MELLNLLVATGGIVMLVAAVAILVDHVWCGGAYVGKDLAPFALMTATLTATAGAVLALYYSDVLGFVPCGLCWFQRIFLFPQAFIGAVALKVRDAVFAPLYGIVLSACGMVFALYQHYLQMGGSEGIPCPAAGAGADCAERILFEFGFMTFPLLSAITFAFLIALYLVARKR